MSEQNHLPADNQPPEDDGNFLHVVIYAGIFLVIAFILAFIIIKGVGRHIVPGKHNPHPTSHLHLPATNGQTMAIENASLNYHSSFPQQKSQSGV